MANNESEARVVQVGHNTSAGAGTIFVYGNGGKDNILTYDEYTRYGANCEPTEWWFLLNITHPVFKNIKGEVLVKGFFLFLKCKASRRRDFYCGVENMFWWFKCETMVYLLTSRVPVESYRSAWKNVYPTVEVPVLTVPLLDDIPVNVRRYKRSSDSGKESDSEDDGIKVGM